MKHAIHKGKSWSIIHDAGLLDTPAVEFFSRDFWLERGALNGQAVGRGSAWFIEAPCGPVVLRHYLRGGWAAAISRQSYFFTGVEESRPFREYHVLAGMYARGLPVPRPVAAICQHRGVLSSGAIMTQRIPSAKTLADVLAGGYAVDKTWSNVGRCIRRFHDAGAWHADLNARNILLDEAFQVFLVDFDKARFNPGAPVKGKGNLNRLKRSLLKLWPANEGSAMKTAWVELMAGYDE